MTQLLDHPYARFLDRVEKPTRYTGREHGARVKDWASVQARVCLAFPDVYDIGMSHLGYRMLYKILNDQPDILAERCYTPWTDLIGELRAHGEFLRSLENRRPLSDFDVVGFSLQYELTFTNILLMLDLGGIPLRSEHRGDDDPLVIAGGPVATHAEAMAMFLDAIAIGDGEELATEVARSWSQWKRERLPREERLRRLAKIPGLYVPSLYRRAVDPDSGFEVVVGTTCAEAPFPVERRLLDDINQFPFPDDGPVGGPEAVFDRMSIEVARGCTEGCRFCQAGMIYRPVRERDPVEVVRTVERALAKSGHDEVSLAALSTADVSCISPMIKRLVEYTAPRRVSLSVASLRAYGLADDLLDDMRTVRAAGLTFAPEAGTQRMRDVINKNVTEEQLLDTAERVFSRGFDKMKLYFMIGLPTEQDEDIEGIIHVGQNAVAVARRLKRHRAKVTVSVSTHVPKPHTPFQWCAMDSLDEIRRKQSLLQQTARGIKGLSLRTHDSVTSVLEGILARGDRRVGEAIERAYLAGAIYDSWEEHLQLGIWERAFDEAGVDRSHYLGTIPVTARVPWDHIEIGLEQGFLLREYQKALKNRLSPPCGKPKGAFIHHTNLRDAKADSRKLVCYDCGIACDLTSMRAEREVQLREMGALEPGVRAHLPVVHDPTNPSLPERVRPPQPGGEPVRWRLRFEKLGPFALLGHLDLARELSRVIRRAGVQIHYSQGFHPKPELSFGPALSLGVGSLCEYVEAKLVDAPREPELLGALNAAASPGLRFVEATRLSANDARINVSIHGARYLIVFANHDLRRLVTSGDRLHGSKDVLRAKVREFMAHDRVTVTRRIKGIGKIVDVRSLTRTLSVVEDPRPLLARAGLVGDLSALIAEVSISSKGSVKVSEVVQALGIDVAFRAVRLDLLRHENTVPGLDEPATLAQLA